MKNKITLFVFILAVHVVANASAQTTDSLEARCFRWSIAIQEDEGWGLVDDKETEHIVSFFRDYKSVEYTYYDSRARGASVEELFQHFNGNYVKIKHHEMFNERQEILLKKINIKFEASFKAYATQEPYCYENENFKAYVMDDLQISFTEFEITFFYIRFGVAYNTCELADGYLFTLTWKEVLPYLKNPTPKTPNYCTPSGPKVDVRSEPNVKASVNFQLDKGEFFEILEEGQTDIVNGKNGKWYKINYNGKG